MQVKAIYQQHPEYCSVPKLIRDGLTNGAKVFCGLTSPHFKLFLKIMDIMSSGPKTNRTIQTVISAKLKSQHTWWYVGVLASWVTCTSVKAPLNAERYIQVLKQLMLPSKQCLFPVYFRKTMPNYILHITTMWLHSKRVQVLYWPARPVPHWRCVAHYEAQKRPRTVEQLKSYIKQERERIPPTRLRQLVSSVPKRLSSVV